MVEIVDVCITGSDLMFLLKVLIVNVCITASDN